MDFNLNKYGRRRELSTNEVEFGLHPLPPGVFRSLL
jgi:hypothetical protein